MLFHITHTHSYETCMAHNEESKTKFQNAMSNASDSGVQIHGIYADPPGHQIFMVVESDTMEQLVKFLNPVIDFADYDIRPVLDFHSAIKMLSNN